MPLSLTSLHDGDLDALRALIAAPGLAGEFDVLRQEGILESKLLDSYRDRAASWIARMDGVPAGFCLTFVVPRAEGGFWASLRIGVAEPFRRRGIGSALLRAVREDLVRRALPGGLHEIGGSAYQPNEAASAFAARHGLHHARSFWRMERSGVPSSPWRWPPGVTLRIFDGSDRALADLNRAYNESFAAHYHFVPNTPERLREILAEPSSLRDGVALAYRGDRCAGFCHNERLGDTGLVGSLGVIPEARGLGLGRALLRWSIEDFAARGLKQVALYVDGVNESALALYRSEGFTVARTRHVWTATPESAAPALSARETRSAAGTTPGPAARS